MVPPILIAERRVARSFMRANAVRLGDAIPFEGDRHIDRRAFAKMLGGGAIRQASGQLYYLDPPGYEDYRTERRSRAITLLALCLLAGVVAGFVTGASF